MGNYLSSPVEEAVFPKNRPPHDENNLRAHNFESPENGHYAVSHGEAIQPKGPILACFHGNLETTSNSLPHWLFAKKHFRALIGFEYPGYGKRSEEVASERAIKSAIPDWIQTLKMYELTGKVFSCGRSLGSFAAIQFAVALGEDCKGIVLVSPMLTAVATKVSYPWYRFLAPVDLLDNETAVRKLSPRVPVLILHGEKDAVVPQWNSEALEQALRDNGNAVTRKVVEGRGHNDVMTVVKDDINQFIETVSKTIN